VNAEKLAGQLEDLQANVDKKTSEYERHKTDATAKLEDLNIAAKEKYEQQTLDLNDQLAAQLTSLETFRTDANKELAGIGIDESGLSFFSKMKDTFKDMLFGPDGFVASLIRFSAESILGEFLNPAMEAINGLIEKGIKKLIGWLTGENSLSGALTKLGSKIGSVLGIGTGAAGTAAGAVGGAADAAAGGGGGAAGGVAGAAGNALGIANLGVGAFNAGFSAVTGARTTSLLFRIDQTNWWTYLVSKDTLLKLNEFLPHLKTLTDDIFFGQLLGSSGIFGQMNDRLIDIAKHTMVLPQWHTEWAAPVGPRISIAIHDNDFSDPDQIQGAVERALAEAGVQIQ